MQKEKRFVLDKRLKKTYKNKRLTYEEKISSMIADTKYYFDNIIVQEATLCTYELYYEKFMINEEVRHDLVYKKYYDYEYDNYCYFYMVMLNNYFDKLKDKVDKSKLSHEEVNVYKDILGLTQTCGFAPEFDYPAYYTNQAVRELINKNIKKIEEKFKKMGYSEKGSNLFNL